MFSCWDCFSEYFTKVGCYFLFVFAFVFAFNTKYNVASQSAHLSGINDIAFSYDDRQLVSAGQDSTIKLWNIYQP